MTSVAVTGQVLCKAERVLHGDAVRGFLWLCLLLQEPSWDDGLADDFCACVTCMSSQLCSCTSNTQRQRPGRKAPRPSAHHWRNALHHWRYVKAGCYCEQQLELLTNCRICCIGVTRGCRHLLDFVVIHTHTLWDVVSLLVSLQHHMPADSIYA